jgi:hypothetical protein
LVRWCGYLPLPEGGALVVYDLAVARSTRASSSGALVVSTWWP